MLPACAVSTMPPKSQASKRSSTRQEQEAKKRLKALSSIGLGKNTQLLAKALETLRALPSEDTAEVLGSNRHHLQEAVDELWSECKCEVELEVSLGKSERWQCTSFSKLITRMIRDCPGFREALVELWVSKPCTQSNPYSLILYGDELVPGNVLALDQTRKLFGCQGCIKDLGPMFIRSDSSWFPLFCIRHTLAAEIPGGMSYVFRMYLRHLLLVEKISARGILVPLDTGAGHNVVLYFKVSNLIADGDALRMLLNWKGAKGKVACFFCLNVLGLAEDDEMPDGCVPISSRDKSSFARATNDDWWSKADTLSLSLQQSVLNKASFAQLQTAMGLNWNERGLLWDKDLRRHIKPIDIATYDTMHTMLADGVGQDEIAAVLELLRDLGDDWSEIRAIMHADWQCCHGQPGNARLLRTTFSQKREKQMEINWDVLPNCV